MASEQGPDSALPAQVQELGAEAFLPKPVNFPDLRDLLHRLLDKSDEPLSDAGPPSSKS
jgi:CheY-like chemotaxis protein